MKGTVAAGNVRAKTGTMTHVRSLAGYVTTADGEPLAFAIIANNFEGPAAGVTATIDAIATRLAGLRR
jgi:D-alanyl-D-alanine carboxypeptidase/D-alanyl-D-alanine-endopeptidase (penicillin-binding protein 4)